MPQTTRAFVAVQDERTATPRRCRAQNAHALRFATIRADAYDSEHARRRASSVYARRSKPRLSPLCKDFYRYARARAMSAAQRTMFYAPAMGARVTRTAHAKMCCEDDTRLMILMLPATIRARARCRAFMPSACRDATAPRV